MLYSPPLLFLSFLPSSILYSLFGTWYNSRGTGAACVAVVCRVPGEKRSEGRRKKMRVYDIILKKRNGGELSREEIGYLIAGYTEGTIPDCQLSAFAMAVYFRGMSHRETLDLTLAMAGSGEMVSLSGISGPIVDKHSTGGVGDTTTLVLVPLVASAGVPVAKMSGRGLGHTGGTLDKLAAIPGFRSDLSIEEMIGTVEQAGAAVVGQTETLVPADKKFYALRDRTATVDSLPLIAASIMSKKLAAGADALLLDVKTGDGAFMKEPAGAFALAETMVRIGTGAGRETAAVITSMEQPLGRAVGSALEVEEAVLTLQGRGPADLTALSLFMGGWMLFLAQKAASPQEGREQLAKKLAGGAALEKFREMIRLQHGDAAIVDDLSLLPRAAATVPVQAHRSGYIHRLGAELVGRAALALGGGRRSGGGSIDAAVGVTLVKKRGDFVESGETLAQLHLNCAPGAAPAAAAEKLLREAYALGPAPTPEPALICGYVDRAGRHSIQCGGGEY